MRVPSTAIASRASSMCLCGTSRDSTATRGVTERATCNVPGGAVSSPLRTTAIRSTPTPSSTRSRADGSDTVTYWLRRCTRGENVDSHAQRPLLAMAVMHQHRDTAAENQPGEERPSVLGVDGHVGPYAAQWTEAEPC